MTTIENKLKIISNKIPVAFYLISTVLLMSWFAMIIALYICNFSVQGEERNKENACCSV